MRAPRVIEVLLALSLVLNLFGAGGFAYSLYSNAQHAPPPQPQDRRLEQLAEKSGINPTDSKPFKDWRRTVRVSQGIFWQRSQPLLDDIWDELASATQDSTHLQQLLDEQAGYRHTFQAEVAAATVRFMATMTTEQRAAFLKLVMDKRDPLGAQVRNGLGY